MVDARDATAKPPLAAMAVRIEELLGTFDALATPRQNRERAEELVRTIVGVYGEGLERMLTIVHESVGEERSREVFERLCGDTFVESLLCLHGLHPYTVEERVAHALDAVRPYLESHDGGIEVVGVEGDVAIVRLQGGCSGCPSSRATLEMSVERAILERVPEIRLVRAEGVDDAPARLNSLRLESDWLQLDAIDGLDRHGIASLVVAGTPVVLARLGTTMYAYRDACPGCGAKLGGGALSAPWLQCPGCERRYDLVRAGRADGDARLFAEPFPLSSDNGRVRIAVPVGA